MKNQIKLLAFITLALLTVKSYSQSGNSIAITPAIAAQSTAFKNLAGQNRLIEFKAFQPLLVTISSKTIICKGVAAADFTTRAELYSLLGTPSAILSPNVVAYNLSANNQACQSTVGIDNNDLVLFTQINNCP